MPLSLGRRRLAWLLLAALVVGYAVSSWFASTALLTPRRRVPDAPARPVVESLELVTSDGLTLAAWIAEPDAPARATVVLCHGIDGHRSAAHLAFLVDLGFRGLALDHRAHGASGGSTSGFGLHERHDARAAIDLARERWPDDPVLGWGTSMGAAALVYAAADAEARGDGPLVDGLVLESLYADIDTAYQNRIRLRGAWLLPFALGPRWLALLRGDLDPSAMRPVDILPRLADVPLFLASGATDRRTTPAELSALAAAAPHAEVVLVPDIGHRDLLRRAPPSYAERVAAFLDRCVAEKPPRGE